VKRIVAALAVLAVGAASRAEDAAPLGPRPLERKVDDADLVVVAKLRTTPALVGEEFAIDVDEVLKGKSVAGPLRVRAAFPVGTRLPIPADVPKPPAAEGAADGDKVMLFLDAPADGVRQSRDPIVLRPAETVSSWRLPGLRATLARETVRALARLDAEDDVAAAVDLWVAGLGDSNAPTKSNLLLLQCLMQRVAFAGGALPEKAALGERLASRATRDFAAGRARILKAIVGWASAFDRSVSYLAIHAGRGCVPPRDVNEGEIMDSLLMCGFDCRGPEAVEALHLAFDLDAPSYWRFGLCNLLDERASPRDRVESIADMTRDFVRARPEREALVVETLLPPLDDARAAPGELALRRVTGETLHGADEWRAWWKKRAAK